MSVAPQTGRNRIMIYGPKPDGTYVVEFETADGDSLAISVPAGETRVLKHFQARMPFGLFVPLSPSSGVRAGIAGGPRRVRSCNPFSSGAVITGVAFGRTAVQQTEVNEGGPPCQQRV
jgi:hypothetical protein